MSPDTAPPARSAEPTIETAPTALANGHVATYRVRFDEATPTALLRTSGLLRYAQDVAWMHSEALGFDRAWYRERSLAWLVRAAEIEVLAPIPMGRDVRVSTAVVGHRRVWARRRAEVRLPDDRLAAWVHTDWVLIDGRGRITRVPRVFGETFPAPLTDEALLRVDLPSTPADADRRRFSVRLQELDPMGHVNNAVYLDWLEECVAGLVGSPPSMPLEVLPRRYRLEYAAAADAGSDLEAATWPIPGGWAHRVLRSDGTELLRGEMHA